MYKDIKELRPFSEGLAAFKNKDDLWGFMDHEGKIIIEPIYSDILSDFKNGVSIVETANIIYGRSGYYKAKMDIQRFVINKKGKRISKDYLYIKGFHDGLSVVGKYKLFSNKLLYGYINTLGKEVIPCKYEYASFYRNKECVVKDFNNKELTISYDSGIIDKYEYKKDDYVVDENIYNKLKSIYKYVEKIDSYYIISNNESFDDIYGGVCLGLANEKGEVVFPLEAYDIKKIDNNLFLIDKIYQSILLDTTKKDMNDLSVGNFIYESGYKEENHLLSELNNSNDFVLIEKTNPENAVHYFCLANKKNLKVKIIPADILVYKNNIAHIYDGVKGILKYLDLSKINFDGIDITNTNFVSTNAKINPQTVYNKDLSGVSIIATQIVNDLESLEPNYEDVITDDNTKIIGEYIDYKKEKKLIRKL